MKPRCLIIGLSPAVQKSLIFSRFLQGEVNRSECYYTDAAGKCVNVCRVMVQGGMDAVCLSPAGRENREAFTKLCRRDGVVLEAVETGGRVRTCTTLIERETGITSEIVANEPETITEEEENRFLAAFDRLLEEDFSGVIITGSRLPGFSDEVIPSMVKSIKRKGLPLFVDYRGKDLNNSMISRTVRPDYIKINEAEFRETFGEGKPVKEGMDALAERYGITVIISRGGEDIWASEKGRFFSLENSDIDVVNPIGCGDSMTAGLAQGILEGLSVKKALTLGRDYATVNAQRVHPGWIKENRK